MGSWIPFAFPSGQLVTRALSETTTISETRDRVALKFRAIATQTTTQSGTVDRMAIKFRSMSETRTISETLARIWTKVRPITTQTVSISEQLARLKTAIRSISQTTTVGETLTRLAIKFRGATQTTSLSDALSRVTIKIRAPSTEVTAIDQVLSRLKTAIRKLYEAGPSRSLYADSVPTGRAIEAINNGLNIGTTPNSEISISFWIKISPNTGIGTVAQIFFYRTGLGNAIEITYDQPSNSLLFDVSFKNIGTIFSQYESVLTDSWYHVVLTHSDVSDTTRVYVNSVVEYNNISNDDYLDSTSGEGEIYRVRMGNIEFIGNIDDVRLYNTALTQTQVSNLYSGQNITSGQVVHWKLDGNGNDSAGSINATIHSNASYSTDLPVVLARGVEVSESLARMKIASRSMNQTISVSDSIAKLAIRPRTVPTESITITDSIARFKKAIVTLSQTTTISETLARFKLAIRSISQTTSISETLARIATKFRSIATQTVSITEDLDVDKLSTLITRSIEETVNRSETLSRLKIAIRSLSQTTVIEETLVRIATKLRSISETRSISDSISRIHIAVRSLSQNIPIEETLTRLAIKLRSLSESRSVTANIARMVLATRSLSTESTVVSETLLRTRIHVRAISQTVTLSEVLARQLYAFRSISQTTSISDSIAKLRTAIRSMSQTVSVTDSIARMAIKLRSMSQTVTSSETLVRAALKFRSISTQTITISDSVDEFLVGITLRAITETVKIGERVSRGSLYSIAISFLNENNELTPLPITGIQVFNHVMVPEENTPVSDTLLRTRVTRAISQTIVTSETLVRSALKFRSASQTTSITEDLAKQRIVTKTLSQTTTISESLTRLKYAIRNISQTTTISETLARLATKFRTMSQTTTISETLEGDKAATSRSITENTSISDSITRFKKAIRSIGQTITISDSLTGLKAYFRSITENTTLSDQLSRVAILLRSVPTQTVSIGETVVRMKKAIRTHTDSTTISDQLSRLSIKVRAVSQSVSITDSLIRFATRTRSLTETVTRSESVVRLKRAIRTLTQTISLSETLARAITSTRIIRNITETINLTDSITRRLARQTRAIIENIPIFELLQTVGGTPTHDVPDPGLSVKQFHFIRTPYRTVPRLPETLNAVINKAYAEIWVLEQSLIHAGRAIVEELELIVEQFTRASAVLQVAPSILTSRVSIDIAKVIYFAAKNTSIEIPDISYASAKAKVIDPVKQMKLLELMDIYMQQEMLG